MKERLVETLGIDGYDSMSDDLFSKSVLGIPTSHSVETA
jgi:hypothetical protein